MDEEIKYLKKYYKGDLLSAIERLEKGEPVQYIVGDVDFYGNIIKVDKRVLIPRRETEELIEKALKHINSSITNIADLGTGSGCIAITLKKMMPDASIDAVDISSEALDVAKINAKLNKVDINFYLGNMLEPLKGKYDLIISNPPYIAHDEEIMDIVKNNEPLNALYADNNGLYYYEEILKNCSNYLCDNYLIAFEIGYNQGEDITFLAHKYLNNVNVVIEKDLQGFDRFCFIKKEM